MISSDTLLVEPYKVPVVLQVNKKSREVGEERYKLLFGAQLSGEKAIRFDPVRDTLRFQDYIALNNFVESAICVNRIKDLHQHYIKHGPLFDFVQNMVIGGGFGFSYKPDGHLMASNFSSVVWAVKIVDPYPASIEGFEGYDDKDYDARAARHFMLMMSWAFKNLKVLRFDNDQEMKETWIKAHADVFEKGIGGGERGVVLEIGGTDGAI